MSKNLRYPCTPRKNHSSTGILVKRKGFLKSQAFETSLQQSSYLELGKYFITKNSNTKYLLIHSIPQILIVLPLAFLNIFAKFSHRFKELQ